MKLSPYILARIAGLPFQKMEELRWNNDTILASYFQSLEEVASAKQVILSELLTLINQLHDYPAKFYLKIIRRDIYNDRTIKIKSFDYSGELKDQFYQLIKKVQTYKELLAKMQLKKEECIERYEKELLSSRKILHNTPIDDDLENGLILASRSFYERLNVYQATPIDSFNKKVFQSEAKYLQYLTRACTKTSPFSSFTKLAVLNLGGSLNYEPAKKVRLNNYLFQLFQDTLSNYFPFYQTLPIRLNPSLALADDQYRFILNTRNIESIQRIERADIIDFILEVVRTNPEKPSFNEIVQLLQDRVEASSEELGAYLIQLIEFGILEWQWPFSALDPDWLSKTISLLKNNSVDVLLEELMNVLENIKKLMQEFASSSVHIRIESQTEAFKQLEEIADKLLVASELKGKENNISSNEFGQILTTKFDFKLEKIFYEDVSQNPPGQLDKSTIQAVGKELHILVQTIQPLYYNHKKEALLQFYTSNYNGDHVKLIDFYEAFYQKPVEKVEQPKSTIRVHRTFYTALSKAISETCPDQLHINLHALPFPENRGPHAHSSFASFIQLSNEDHKAYVDSVIMGYGKMFGRFLHLFPKDLTNAIRQRNHRLTNDAIWLENVDASVFNPNVHPPLMDREIQTSGSQNNLPIAQQVPISELDVGLDESGKRLALYHQTKGERTYIFDFGFEAPESRSNMFKLLNAFNYDLAGPETLINMLDQEQIQEKANGIIIKPRITAGEHLILRRKSWGIPQSLIPIKSIKESDAHYFLRINEWRRDLELPEKVFYVVAPAEFGALTANDRKSDNYKPQYMDFKSPLHVLLFAKAAKKVKEYLKMEEMLPIPKEGDFAKEYLIEWDKP